MSERIIEVEADSLEEARRKVYTEEVIVLEETIVCHGKAGIIEAVADSVEDAFRKAQSGIPAGAKTETQKTKVAPPKRFTLLAQADDEESAGKGKVEAVASVSLHRKGRKGFLGFGKSPNVYEVVVSQQAVVELKFREQAKLRVRVRGYLAEDLLESIQKLRSKNAQGAEILQLLNPKKDSEVQAQFLKIQELNPLSALDIIENVCRKNEKANWQAAIKEAHTQVLIARERELEEKKIRLRGLDVEIAETFMFYTSIDWYEKDYARRRKEPTGIPRDGYDEHHRADERLRQTIPRYSTDIEAFSRLERRVKWFNLYESYLQLLNKEGQDEKSASLEQKCQAALDARKLPDNKRTVDTRPIILSPPSQNNISELRKTLLTICLGNEVQVDRLINLERKHSPTASEEQLYNDAVERLKRDKK